jgi:hypothetical protein
LDDTGWVLWLRAVTHEDTVRGIARAAGVSHTTVQRWLVKGVPARTVWDLTLKFKGDPIAALVVLERVTPEQVGQLNFAAVMKYADVDMLTAELHERATRARAAPVQSEAFTGHPFRFAEPRSRRSHGVPLGRSDNLARHSCG